MLALSFLTLCAFIIKLDISHGRAFITRTANAVIHNFHPYQTFPERFYEEDFIVGGSNANIEDYPYQVSIQKNSHFFCGGSILKPKVILTAGHCIHKLLNQTESLSVRAGSSYANKEGQLQSVEKLYLHPKYNSTGPTADYDVAILILKAPFILSKSIKDIQLISDEVPAKTLGTVTGYGTLEYLGAKPDQLQMVKVPKITHEECSKLYPKMVSPRMTCYAYPEGKKDACQGDSGGPIVVDNKLAGVVSWGWYCALPKNPGVYADVLEKDIAEFIKKYNK